MRISQKLAIGSVLLAMAFVIYGGLGPMDRDPAPPVTPPEPTDTLLVDMADHLTPEEQRHFIHALDEDAVYNSTYSTEEGLFRLSESPDELRAIYAKISSSPKVEFAEYEHEYTTFGVHPDDPLYRFQWNFDQLHVEKAWSTSQGKSAVVAVIDTGVVYTADENQKHPALRDLQGTSFVPGYDFVSDDTVPLDEHGHGTHVAGTIAQTTDNGYGVAGVAPSAKIMPIRVLNADGRGSTANIAEAIRFAADNDADIINMSLGGPLPSRIMTDAINYAHRKGVTIIAAAGNNGWSLPSFPAANPHVFAVSATQYDKSRTFYSNHGAYIDIAAPGGNTRVDQNDDGRPDGIMQETIAQKDPSTHEFALYMGTSMACPHVAGVAALIHAEGTTRPERIESILMESADTDVPNYNEADYGAGLLDANQALTTFQNDHELPLIALFASLLGLLFSFRRRLWNLSWPIAAITGAFVMVGIEPFIATLRQWGMTIIPAATGFGLGGWHEAAIHTLPQSWVHHPLLWSAIPVVVLWGLLAHMRNRTIGGIAVGVSVAWIATLIAQSIAPTVSLSWFPNIQILETIWLFAGGLIAAVVTWFGLVKDSRIFVD